MPLDWRTAYLQQARSDYAILQGLLADNTAPLCQCLHYLQMATEKLSKGLRTAASGTRPPRTHDALIKFMQVAKRRPEIQQACGFTQNQLFAAYMDNLLPLAQAVEDLSPDGGDHPNPEYPWEQGGVIASPLSHPFGELELRPPSLKMAKLLELIADCLTIS